MAEEKETQQYEKLAETEEASEQQEESDISISKSEEDITTEEPEISLEPEYALQEKLLAEQFYNSDMPFEYKGIGYDTAHEPLLFEPTEEYQSAKIEETESETMTTEEAEETVVERQYAIALGHYHDGSAHRRQRLANWFLQNPSLGQLFHTLYAVTSNVDYSRVF